MPDTAATPAAASPLSWGDEAIADLIADTLDNHHDMDVGFDLHARYIVATLRDNGLLAGALLDVDGVRDSLARIHELGRRTLGDRFHFATVTIWGADRRERHAAIGVTLHIANNGTRSFAAGTVAAALDDAERFLAERDPAKVEAEGWATLGVLDAGAGTGR